MKSFKQHLNEQEDELKMEIDFIITDCDKCEAKQILCANLSRFNDVMSLCPDCLNFINEKIQSRIKKEEDWWKKFIRI